jgi:hypothetical protein
VNINEAYSSVFGSANGQVVLNDLLYYLGWLRNPEEVVVGIEDSVRMNVARHILSHFPTIEDRRSVIQSLFTPVGRVGEPEQPTEGRSS